MSSGSRTNRRKDAGTQIRQVANAISQNDRLSSRVRVWLVACSNEERPRAPLACILGMAALSGLLH